MCRETIQEAIETLQQARANWQNKIAFLERERSIKTAPTINFEIDQQIKECEERIQGIDKRLEAYNDLARDGQNSSGLDQPLDDGFLVPLPDIERICDNAIRNNQLIVIKSPWQTGKTTLIQKVLKNAEQKGYQTVYLSFHNLDLVASVDSVDFLLRWFCDFINKKLVSHDHIKINIPNTLEEYWPNNGASIANCGHYFKTQVLSRIPGRLVVGMDDIENLYVLDDSGQKFFDMLRGWNQDGGTEFGKLRLMVAYSHKIPPKKNKNIYQSPFNIGNYIELRYFTLPEIQKLVDLYKIELSKYNITQIMNYVSGHPCLIQITLENLYLEIITFQQLTEAISNHRILWIYNGHLDILQEKLFQKNSSQSQPDDLHDDDLRDALRNLLKTDKPVFLKGKLREDFLSLGLVKQSPIRQDHFTISCQLYRQYFDAYLQGDRENDERA